MHRPADHHIKRWPNVITNLPEANIDIRGIKAWILQGEEHQLVFFEMEPGAYVPEHSHDYDQWGTLIQGEMKLTINDKTVIIKGGDEYIIPARSKHRVEFQTQTRVIDFFSESTRYKVKMAK
jgi:quercetin dioxygenase-like cupin family protein